MFIYILIYLHIYLFTCLFTCLFIYLLFYMFIFLYNLLLNSFHDSLLKLLLNSLKFYNKEIENNVINFKFITNINNIINNFTIFIQNHEIKILHAYNHETLNHQQFREMT